MLTLRLARPDDSADLLAWRNDASTRRMFFQPDPVDEESHRVWYANSLRRDDRILVIGEVSDGKAGIVRFDRTEGSEWEVSITVNPQMRGRGLGARLLSAAIAERRNEMGNPDLIARIKPENAASQRIFEKAGFELEEESAGQLIMRRPAAGNRRN
jgi:UDP-2,4-diacetamido-2,4,6-trideoxy-beta-L-altropyranose hydrolase